MHTCVHRCGHRSSHIDDASNQTVFCPELLQQLNISSQYCAGGLHSSLSWTSRQVGKSIIKHLCCCMSVWSLAAAVRRHLLHQPASKFLLGSVPMQVLPAFLERVFLHMRSWNTIVKHRSKLKVLTVVFSSNTLLEKQVCTYIRPSVNITINIKNRQNIEVQAVEKTGRDCIFSIGLNSLVWEK